METQEKIGNVKIANDVIAAVAGLAATENRGVQSLAGGITHDMITHSGIKKLSRSVKVEVDDGKIRIQLALTVNGLLAIPEVTADVSKRVKNAVETMTGLQVVSVKITISGATL